MTVESWCYREYRKIGTFLAKENIQGDEFKFYAVFFMDLMDMMLCEIGPW